MSKRPSPLSASPLSASPLSASPLSASPRRGNLSAFLEQPIFVAGMLILLVMTVLALGADLLYPGDPQDMVGPPLLWPFEDTAFPLGTDSLGRDIAAGLVHGARVSLIVGFSAASIGLVIGTLVGAMGGYFGGLSDNILVRITELFQTVPKFLLVVVIVAIGEPSLKVIALAIGIASWPTIARLVRAQFRSLREQDFVMAARSLGYSDARIIFIEILPNALPPIVVTTSVMIAAAILTETGLSFLNMGDPNVVSWGTMIGGGREMLRTAWFLTALPGCATALCVLAMNLIGDGLNEIFNPRMRP